MEFGILIFDSTQAALQAETAVKAKELKGRIIPVPEQLVASCGFALKYDLVQVEIIKKMIAAGELQSSGNYHAIREGLKTNYTKI